jgi:pimeloyl-ACP methyl ester carboxylesterase
LKHHVIYVPGLGDHRPYGQPLIISFWRLYGLSPHYHAVGWADSEAFTPKLKRLIELIDSIKTADNKVSLVGVSAGASAVLTAYCMSPDKINGVVCISGKIQNGDAVGEQAYIRNPAFREAMAGLPEVLAELGANERKRIMSIHPIKDRTVPPSDTIITGALEKRVWAYGHIQSIFYCLLFSGRTIANFLKSLK